MRANAPFASDCQSFFPAVRRRPAARQSESLATAGIADANRRAWSDVIDHQLIEWVLGHIDIDGDLIPPTVESLRLAIETAQWARDSNLDPPTSVLPDGDGGVQFERRVGQLSFQFDVLFDGDVQEVVYNDGKVVKFAFHRSPKNR